MPSATEPSPPARTGGETDERDVSRVVRAAALSCYGVADVTARRWLDRVAALIGRGSAGVAVDAGAPFKIEVNVILSPSVPQAQVVANVADAIRYAVHRDFGRSIDELSVMVDGVTVAAGS
jgi:uncharacterized alkaline shock family protein YloU